MISEKTIFSILILLVFVAAILFIIFGQVTVRKLRKISETKDVLGVEFLSGWDIINIAQALTIPRKWSHKLRNSPLSMLYADPDQLYKHTNKFDRFLAKSFYILLMTSGGGGLLLFLMDMLGLYSLFIK